MVSTSTQNTRNGAFSDLLFRSAAHNQITMYNRGATQWLDFAPQHIVGLAISQHSVAAAFEDGSIACYSLNGDR